MVKRLVKSAEHLVSHLNRWLFYLEEIMNLFVYSDESGTFDHIHHDYFVFGGLILTNTENKIKSTNYYLNAEKALNSNLDELKASLLNSKQKYSLYRSLNKEYKFGIVIAQKELNLNVFENKKHKQRYLDYAYKIGLKKALKNLIKNNIIKPSEVEYMYVFNDEHNTATDGKYELRESLEREFKIGTFNSDYKIFFEPLFKNLKSLELKYCDSKEKPLIRASDIIANNILHNVKHNLDLKINTIYNNITFLP